ncbi:hypothetical protein [Chitinophaga nivalis]|uniref:DUF4142 domain-containing protein n=1 Tax=Chitinophaga nivalis TaxID=2991709 RepID=A0ABT3IKJ4_9BACT|nr:hypothetical protein [Chitinophaga nivalis]MCW3465835.1 hypothetical protein [Chitinophaga nivalis]MCW3484474.1 hypothetical protein [Chitinophaga nivalis]
MLIKGLSRVILLIACCFYASQAAAQSATVTDVTKGIFTWVKHLNNDVDKYATREKSAELNQHLTNLKQELNNYLKTRKSLSDSLLRNNIKPGKQSPEDLENVKLKMRNVMEQIRNINDLTNREIREEGDRLNDEIYDALFGEQSHYLSHLEAFLDGKDVTKKDLALDNSMGYDRLQSIMQQVSATQEKLDRKYK